MPFKFGVPFTISGEAAAYGSGGGGFTDDFVSVMGLDIYDASGDKLDPATLTVSAASGKQFHTEFGVPYNTVPEPATALLMGALAGLWWWRNR